MQKALILDTAVHLLKQTGIRHSTFDLIAGQLNISENTLHQLFRNKEELLQACLQACYEKILLTGQSNKRQSPLISLIYLTRKTLEYFDWCTATFFDELRQDYPTIFQTYKHFLTDQLHMPIHYHLEHGLIEDYFRPHIDIDQFSTLYIDLLDCAIRKQLLDGNSHPTIDLIKIFFLPLIKGVAKIPGEDNIYHIGQNNITKGCESSI